MTMYRYVKATPRFTVKNRLFVFRKSHTGIVSLLLITAGISLMIWTFWPIIAFTLFTDPLLAQIISPVAEAPRGLAGIVQANSVENTMADPSTNANTWYPAQPQKKVLSPVNAYSLSIPKLRIKNATVIIAGDDLNSSLIHYGGTGLPGQYGTAVIFGHSTLPQFYNPTDYKTIFSTLPTLKIGDRIDITYDGVTYAYKIFAMTVTEPTDLSPLEQQFDDSYVTLITCVPPGTTWKRLNVKARLVKPGDLSS